VEVVYKGKISAMQTCELSLTQCLYRKRKYWSGFPLTTYYVYLLRSVKDGKFYTGYTANLRNRLARHNGGRVRSTKRRRPLELVYWESFETRAEVMRREKKIKTFGRAQKEKLIERFK